MACPTCDGTMQATGCKVTDRPFFWCPRCGTFKSCDGEVAVPALIAWCRSFQLFIDGHDARLAHEWRVAGINEAINTPERRIP